MAKRLIPRNWEPQIGDHVRHVFPRPGNWYDQGPIVDFCIMRVGSFECRAAIIKHSFGGQLVVPTSEIAPVTIGKAV